MDELSPVCVCALSRVHEREVYVYNDYNNLVNFKIKSS